MRKILSLMAVLLLMASACGSSSSDGAEVVTTTTVADTTEPVATDPEPAETTEEESTTTEAGIEVAKPPTVAELIASTEPLNIAHAGGDQAYPHSTPFAFASAIADGADVLEMDVQLSADGVIVVQHDDTVDKRTEATGRVDSMTAAELYDLDGAYWFAPGEWPSHDLADDAYIYRGVRTGDIDPPEGFTADDFAITSLREISERFPSMPFNIEMKGSFSETPEIATALAAELTELGRVDSTVVVSFDDELVDAFHAAAPDIAVSPGLNVLTNWILAGEPLADYYQIVQLPPESSGVEVLNPGVIQLAADAGVVIWAWPSDASTQENGAFYQSLLDLGVHSVIVGVPAEFSAL